VQFPGALHACGKGSLTNQVPIGKSDFEPSKSGAIALPVWAPECLIGRYRDEVLVRDPTCDFHHGWIAASTLACFVIPQSLQEVVLARSPDAANLVLT
jgi:hypothetical protein